MDLLTILLFFASMGALLLWTGLQWRKKDKQLSAPESIELLRNRGRSVGLIIIGTLFLLLVLLGLAAMVFLGTLNWFIDS